MQAGFDLSAISIENWNLLLKKYSIDEEPVKTEKGWVWLARYTNAYNFVVTANNPITGFYYHDRFGTDESQPGYVGYVGIEGDAEFVANFFVDFKEMAEYVKDEVFGNRSFI